MKINQISFKFLHYLTLKGLLLNFRGLEYN